MDTTSTPPEWPMVVDTACLALILIALVTSSIKLPRVLWTKRNQKGHIKLRDDFEPTTRKHLLERKLLEHVPQETPDDGEPVNVAEFWKTTILAKVTLLSLALANLAIQITEVAESSLPLHVSWFEILKVITVALSNIYILLLSTHYLFTRNLITHTRLTVHLCAISSIPLLHWYLQTFGKFLWRNSGVHVSRSAYAALCLAFLETLISGFIPMGPKLWVDLTSIYTKDVRTRIKEYPATAPKGNLTGELSCSIYGQLMYSFVYPMILKIAKMDQVDIQDLPGVQADLRCQNLYHEVNESKAENDIKWKNHPTMSLLWTVWWPQRRAVSESLIYALALCPLWYLPHICLQQILVILDDKTALQWSAVAFAGLMVISKVCNTVVKTRQINIHVRYVGPRIRSHTSFLLFQKILTRNMFAAPEINREAEGVHTKADILNLISSDAASVQQISWTFIELFRSLIEMALGCSYVWILLGPSGLWGLTTLLLTCFPAYLLTRWEYRVFEKKLAIKDVRVGLMQEAVQAISMIKMMATEKFWFRRISRARGNEFNKLTQARLIGYISGFLYSAAPTVIIIVAFAHYTLVAKKELTATIAFTSIAVFNELRPVLINLPTSVADLLQEILSARRIATFLGTREVEYLDEVLPASGFTAPAGGPLYVKGTIAWDNKKPHPSSTSTTDSESITSGGTDSDFRLIDLDVKFPRGKLSLVAGKYGSGKSLLLLALLGEARVVEGKVSYCVSPIMNPKSIANTDWSLIEDGVAYAPQIPWLLSQSIRDNILFGLPLNIERYRAVCFATGLMPDLQNLEDADLTEIGERGKILSGGQKARVSLARAVYSCASVVILDDVISAVDAQTSQHIITHCFNSPLMKDRTVILASHAVEALAPLAKQAIYLEDGRCLWQGSGTQLLESEHMSHLKTVVGSRMASRMPSRLPSTEDIKVNFACTAEEIKVNTVNVNTSELDTPQVQTDQGNFEIREAVPKTPKQLILEEGRLRGAVNIKHWKNLLRFNGGALYWTVGILLMLGALLSPVAESKILSLWTGMKGEANENHTVVFWVSLYAVLSLTRVVLSTVNGMFRFLGSVKAMKIVHEQMLDSMLHAKMSFFTGTRAGSIIQRFSKDLNDILQCSNLLTEITTGILKIIVSLITVSAYGGWPMALITAMLIALAWYPAKLYRASSRQVRRLQSIVPGPINALIGETAAGTSVIRAFGAQSIFLEDLMGWINMKTCATIWTASIAWWLCLSIEIMDVLIRIVILTLLLLHPSTTGAVAGFVLTFAGDISSNVSWVLKQLRSIEVKGISLERTSEYRTLPREDGSQRGLMDTSSIQDDDEDFEQLDGHGEALGSWPDRGELVVSDLCARYGPDMPEILHGITFKVKAGERVGIVGATGGGKSTLAKAFFSFVDVTQGKIEIDGKDISQIPLGAVRSRLGIIAQDPILLSGSLRLNLDIEGKYSDEELYHALRQVQLIQTNTDDVGKFDDEFYPDLIQLEDTNEAEDASSDRTAVHPPSPVSQSNFRQNYQRQNTFSNLDFEIKTSGENLSTGQRQLIVLARALLKKHRVLILDEATASIDSATDVEISRVVHEEFIGVSVLIIAHRLRTIMPCSKILVMDKGNLIQEGSPLDLIQQEGGKFHMLCKAAGEEEFQHLLEIASQHENDRQIGIMSLEVEE